MRNGKLNKTEKATIERAKDVLNAWIDFQEGRGIDPDSDLAVNRACTAVVSIIDFMEYYDD